MKVNFNTQIKDFDGKPFVENGKPLIARELVAKALFVGDGIKRTGNDEKYDDNRFKAYHLNLRVMASDNEIDLSPEELVLIKQAVTIYRSAGLYAQLRELVDRKEE